jgi:hypothetical protein
MSASAHGLIDRLALEKLIAGGGVTVTSEDVEAVARSLERMQQAASNLVQSLPFDETAERFHRLLGIGATDRTGP